MAGCQCANCQPPQGDPRAIPLSLQLGKRYARLDGTLVLIDRLVEADSALYDSGYRFRCSHSGESFMPNGQYWPQCVTPERDLARPVYEVGGTYMTRAGVQVHLHNDDNDSVLPLDGDNRISYRRNGLTVMNAEGDSDNLMDYAPTGAQLVMDPGNIRAGSPLVTSPEPADPWIGKRVSFYQDGRRGIGTVMAKHPGQGNDEYAVEVENVTWGHPCHPFNLSHGWNVYAYNMSEVLAARPDAVELPKEAFEQAVVEEVAVLAPIPAIPLSDWIGKRVIFQENKKWEATVVDTDNGWLIIEFDLAGPGAMWKAGGKVPSGRGLYCYPMDLTEIPDTRPNVEGVVFNEEDRAAVWDAYVTALSTSPKQTVELDIFSAIVDARRRLNTA